MENKDSFLEELKGLLRSGELTKEEVMATFSALPAGDSNIERSQHNTRLAAILYYIGSAIVFIGIAIFVGNHWDDLSSFFRILATLGVGLAFFATGMILGNSERTDRVPDALQCIAGLLIPSGIFVTLHELGFGGGAWGPGIIFFFLMLAYIMVIGLYNRNVFVVFAIVYGTIATFLLTNAMVEENPIFDAGHFAAYRVFVIGAAYVAFGYSFSSSFRRFLSGMLYALGTLSVLSAAIFLGGWQPEQLVLWEFFSFVLAFAAMYASIRLRATSMLVLGALFVVGNILKITYEYFKNDLSWPLLLVLFGALFIGAGYATFYLNRKYIKS